VEMFSNINNYPPETSKYPVFSLQFISIH